MKRLPFIFLLSFIILTNCGSNEKPIDRSLTTILKYYNTRIPVENHIFILIPSFSCSGCMQRTLNDLNKLLSSDNKQSVSIIYQKKTVFLSELDEKATLYWDHYSKLDNLSIDLANPVILKTKNKKVEDVIYVTIENLDQIINNDLILWIVTNP